jgi:hypothetical protein
MEKLTSAAAPGRGRPAEERSAERKKHRTTILLAPRAIPEPEVEAAAGDATEDASAEGVR